MEEGLEIVMNNYKNITPLSGIEDLNLGKLRHQEGPSTPGMKIFFVVTAMLPKTLDTKQFIVNPMKEIIILITKMIMDIQRITM